MGGQERRVLSGPVLSYAADRLAMVLVSHLDVVEDLLARLDAAEVTGRYRSPEILEDLDKLRALRSTILDSLRLFGQSELGSDVEQLRDIHALVAYYIEVAYKSEARALRAASSALDVRNDLAELSEAYELAVRVRERIASLIRSIDASWLT